MDKRIIDDIKFEVEQEEQENFIKIFKSLKNDLVKNNTLPHSFRLFKDIDKETNIFTLIMEFKSDLDFDKWDIEVKKNKLIENYFSKEFKKYVRRYNYSEEIIL